MIGRDSFARYKGSLGTRPLRVVVVHNRYRSAEPSGEDRVVDQESVLLAEAGHHVIPFEKHSDDIASMSLLGKLAVPLQVPWSKRVHAELTGVLRAARPDIVHIHNTFPLVTPSAVWACIDSAVPVVATLHNYSQVCPTGSLYREGAPCMKCTRGLPAASVRHGCYRGSRMATVPRAANLVLNRQRWWSGGCRFLCVSATQRRLLIAAGMPPELLTVKPNFVADVTRRRTGPGEHVLFLGRLSREKGVHTLIAAWDELVARSAVSVPLVLAGSGPMEQETVRWAAGRDDVDYVGLQDRRRCEELIARAAVVVQPSVTQETFGLSIVEAMAAGVPTVAASVGAYTELVDHGVSGMRHGPGNIAELARAIEVVVQDLDLNAKMGLAARRRYEERFTPEIGLDNLVSAYRSVIAAAAVTR